MRFIHVLQLSVLLSIAPAAHPQPDAPSILPNYPIWDESVPYPAREALAPPEGMTRQVVHRAGGDAYNFLHDVAVTEFQETLFTAWYNCPEGEMEEASVIRGKRSADRGKTWSAVEVIAEDTAKQGVMYVPIAFGQQDGRLFGYISTMVGPDLVTDCAIFEYEPKGRASWISRGHMAAPFLPNSAALPLPGGNYLVAGRVSDEPGTKPETPAVALSLGDNLTGPWEIVRLQPDKHLPDGLELRYPETAVIVEDDGLLAFVRNDGGNGLIYTGDPTGRHWSGPHSANMRLGASKMYAGKLSTGQRYLIYTTPTEGYRELLTLAVSRPGARTFSRVFQIHDGPDAALGVGPEWSYPCAVEADGHLYVGYTSAKQYAMLATIPVISLVVP